MRNPGKIFEDDFKKSIPINIFYYRLSDPPQSFNINDHADKLRFSAKNPYDSFVFDTNQGWLFALELKSTGTKSFSYWKESYDGNSTLSIKKHQIKGLLKAESYNRVSAGLVLNFRSSNHTYYVPINDFCNYTNKIDKISINENDVIAMNGIRLSETLKRVHYRYDIMGILDSNK